MLSPLPQPFKCYASINGQMLKCLNVFENQCSKRGAETSTHFVTNSKTLCFAKDSSGRSIQQKINTYRSQYLEFFHVHNFSLVRHIFHESRVFRSRCVTGTFLFAINRWKWRLNKNFLLSFAANDTFLQPFNMRRRPGGIGAISRQRLAQVFL